MALGDQAGLQAVQTAIAQLPGIEKFTDDERAQLTAAVAKIATDSIAQAGLVIQADLAPIVKQVADFNSNVATLRDLLTRVLDEGILIGGKRN